MEAVGHLLGENCALMLACICQRIKSLGSLLLCVQSVDDVYKALLLLTAADVFILLRGNGLIGRRTYLGFGNRGSALCFTMSRIIMFPKKGK